MKKTVTALFEEDRPLHQRAIKVNYFRTGSTCMDVLVGGGMGFGFPVGKIVNLVGESGSGKTFFACELIAAAAHQYKDRFKWVYDDAERGFSFDGKALWGLDIIPDNEADAVRSDTVEELYYNVCRFIEDLAEDEVGIYVVDSLDSLCNLDTLEEHEERMKAGDKGQVYDKGSYDMTSQKFLSQKFFRVITEKLDSKNALLVFVSQLRDNVNAGLYGKKRRKSGGSALDFYCHTVVELRTKEKFEVMDRAVGVCVEASLSKSKTGRPFRKALINILYDYGIDDVSTNIDYVFDLKSPKTGMLVNGDINVGDTTDPRYGKYPSNLDGIKSMLMDEHLYEACREELRASDRKMTKENYIAWMKEDEGRRRVLEAYYGIPLTRDEAIRKAEEDKEFRAWLRRRAIEKWEAVESSVASGRRKYADCDEEGY